MLAPPYARAQLLGAWQRGVHDPVLVFVLEAALTVRRVSFGMQAFATEEEALQATIRALIRANINAIIRANIRAIIGGNHWG